MVLNSLHRCLERHGTLHVLHGSLHLVVFRPRFWNSLWLELFNRAIQPHEHTPRCQEGCRAYGDACGVRERLWPLVKCPHDSDEALNPKSHDHDDEKPGEISTDACGRADMDPSHDLLLCHGLRHFQRHESDGNQANTLNRNCGPSRQGLSFRFDDGGPQFQKSESHEHDASDAKQTGDDPIGDRE
jgi:hypothetical protein